MSEIIRMDVNEEWAHTGIIKAGDFYFLNYCVGNVDSTIEIRKIIDILIPTLFPMCYD